MKTRSSYWICQILGWGSYSALGMWGASQQAGWTRTVTVGYGLYALYSIGLTHLLRREIRRRGWLDSLSAGEYLKVFAAAAITGLIQGLLVITISWALAGSLR